MKKVSQHTMARSWANGLEAERLFVKTVEADGKTVEKVTKKQDIYQHIDYFVDGRGVDVKTLRTLDKIWLEVTNVKGNDGWLNGEAEFIAFHFVDDKTFKIFRREDLLKFVTENVVDTTTTKPPEYMKWYTRSDWDRKDLICKVRYDDIKHLTHKIYFLE